MVSSGDNNITLDMLRHSMAHVLAHAVKRIYGDAVQVTIGPVIEDGFYYDFKVERPFTESDLTQIEKEMKRIVQENTPIVRKTMSRDEAISFFQKIGENFKVEIIEALPPEETLTVYEQGDFTDLCRGPHMPSTGAVKGVGFKLTAVSAAYWRGDAASGESLSRIYGTAFFSRQALNEHIERIAEAKKRDHRVLGPAMDLFSFHQESPGQVIWHPKGVTIRNLLFQMLRHELKAQGYVEIETPQVMSDVLWKRSGHYDKYKENMFYCDLPQEAHVRYAIKPMSCPGGALYYKARRHSYRELPLRVAEFGHVYRYEPSGTLHGLMRVRGFIQDDAHIYCRLDQIGQEIKDLIAFIRRLYTAFGFTDPEFKLGTRPEKYIGDLDTWNRAEAIYRQILEDTGVAFAVNEGDGVFYGPKIDFHVKDALGRTWQCGTIQLDFFMPQRFEMSFVNEKGENEPVIMIHRAIVGSMERFIGVCIENYGGKLPPWWAPVQVKVVPITHEYEAYADEHVVPMLEKYGIRYERDYRNEKISYKIRENQVYKVPFFIIVGQKEQDTRTVSIRDIQGKQVQDANLESFIKEHTWSIIEHVRGGCAH